MASAIFLWISMPRFYKCPLLRLGARLNTKTCKPLAGLHVNMHCVIFSRANIWPFLGCHHGITALCKSTRPPTVDMSQPRAGSANSLASNQDFDPSFPHPSTLVICIPHTKIKCCSVTPAVIKTAKVERLDLSQQTVDYEE